MLKVLFFLYLTEVKEAPKELVTIELAPKEEEPERETVEVTFAPTPEEAPKPEVVSLEVAPKEEAPERETVEVTFAPKETPKPTSPYEAPEDFEIVIEKLKEVEEVTLEEAPEVVTTTTEVDFKKAPTPGATVELELAPEEVPEEEVTTEVTTVSVTKIVKEEGNLNH